MARVKLASPAFAITALAYLIGPPIQQKALDNPASVGPGSRAMMGWFNRHGVMALGIEFAVMLVSAVLARASTRGADDVSGLLTRFRHDGDRFVPHSTAVAVDERPPMVTVPEYRGLWAGIVG